MKTLLFLFTFSILCVHFSFSQVGLLSSNNKSDQGNKDTGSLPSLTVTKDIGNYKKLNDSVKIRLNFVTSHSDSAVGMTKEYITQSNSLITDADISLKSADSAVNKINASIQSRENIRKRTSDAVTKKKLADEIKSLQNDRRNYKLAIDDLTTKKDILQKSSDSALNALGKQTLQITSAETLNRTLLNELATIKNKDFYDKLSFLEKKNQINDSDIYKNQYTTNSYWFLIDSSKEKFDKIKFLDSLSIVYSQIRMAADNNLSVRKDIKDSKLKLQAVKKLSLTKKISSPEDYNEVAESWESLVTDTTDIAEQLNRIDAGLTNTLNLYNSILKNNIKDKVSKQDVKQTDFGAFPQVTSILGKKETIPSLQLYGSYSYVNSAQSFEGNLGISVAPSNTPDTSNLYSIFFPTSSKFLIHSNFTWSFLPVGTGNSDSAKKIGLKLDVSFASKNLIYDTLKITKAFSSSLLYAKAGIEIGILPKRLSIYSNINTATILDKVDEFVANTGIKSKFFGYLDCGSKLYLDPTPNAKIDDKLFIFANLNFVVNGGDVKRITKSNDLVIPSIQVGMVKTLGKF